MIWRVVDTTLKHPCWGKQTQKNSVVSTTCEYLSNLTIKRNPYRNTTSQLPQPLGLVTK